MDPTIGKMSFSSLSTLSLKGKEFREKTMDKGRKIYVCICKQRIARKREKDKETAI